MTRREKRIYHCRRIGPLSVVLQATETWQLVETTTLDQTIWTLAKRFFMHHGIHKKTRWLWRLRIISSCLMPTIWMSIVDERISLLNKKHTHTTCFATPKHVWMGNRECLQIQTFSGERNTLNMCRSAAGGKQKGEPLKRRRRA